MMPDSHRPPALPDAGARQRALLDYDATLLVEAGAGSGKTALITGRVALMLAHGIRPRDIVAITWNANNFKGTRNTKAQKSWSSRAEPEVRIYLPPPQGLQTLGPSRAAGNGGADRNTDPLLLETAALLCRSTRPRRCADP